MLPWRCGWTDNILNFLSGLQKLEQRAEKCTELREKYVELIPSLVAVACFLPPRAKDLSIPLIHSGCMIYQIQIHTSMTVLIAVEIAIR